MRELNRFLFLLVLLVVVGLVLAAWMIPELATIVYALGAIALAVIIVYGWLQSG